MLGNPAVSASSTMQHCVTLSTSESECVTMTHGVKAALARKDVLNFVQPHLSDRAIGIDGDKEKARLVTEYPQGSQGSNNIDVRYHFLRGA